ncbi:DUF1330 domain-containing protein [Actinospica durhamensis]|uniref:DUF1330 domain-containing protein n=1 Tax=Actinospica durhamensis TaxID=1508375 RepID=A0A941ENJ7_9ACTN|nr:DUF1330 domain-containing protein [Actinospica durhamensis]MBR7835685.1 DUF1330 domain-containing protein [Actinospica durhamensis]
MKAYAVAFVRKCELNTEIVEYLQRIDATMDPFEGRFVAHGGGAENVEGEAAMDVIVIEFPSREQLRGWWNSPEYQQIKPLRTNNMDADILFVDGVPAGYRGADSLKH